MPDRNSAKLSVLAPPLNELALQIDPIRYSSIGAGSLAWVLRLEKWLSNLHSGISSSLEATLSPLVRK